MIPHLILILAALPAPSSPSEVRVAITRNGPPASPSDTLEFFLTFHRHPCAPSLSACVVDEICSSGPISCGSMSAAQLAQQIAQGLTADCPADIHVTAQGSVLTIRDDTGFDVFCCVTMSECPTDLGYGLGGPEDCRINNVCSGVCGDEASPPGSLGFNFEKDLAAAPVPWGGLPGLALWIALLIGIGVRAIRLDRTGLGPVDAP